VGTTRFISNLAPSSGSLLPPSLLWLETVILSRMSQGAYLAEPLCTACYLHPAGRLSANPASTGPLSWFSYDPADPTPSIAGTAVGLSADLPTTTASKPDQMYLPSPATRKPPILR